MANGLDLLHEDGFRLVTLSNGAASVADRLLTSANVRDRFERLLSVEDAGAWKPSARAYEYAAQECEVNPRRCCSSPRTPGTSTAPSARGSRTAWVNHPGAAFPATFLEPTTPSAEVDQLTERGCCTPQAPGCDAAHEKRSVARRMRREMSGPDVTTVEALCSTQRLCVPI